MFISPTHLIRWPCDLTCCYCVVRYKNWRKSWRRQRDHLRKTSTNTNAGSGLQFEQMKDANMQRAIAVVDKGESIWMAEIKFNVPYSTQHDRVTGKVKMGAKLGSPSYLMIEEELIIFWLVVLCISSSSSLIFSPKHD